MRLAVAVIVAAALASCSSKKNTARSRWWQAFNSRYNVMYNGSQAYISGSLEKEGNNKDDFTEMIPLYMVGNKESRALGKANFDIAIEKSEKAIKLHSIKRKPEWNKSRRKTAKDLEWLGRKEYNPVLWKAWLMMGMAQFQKGEFDEAAATFAYMSRLYSTQPAIYGIARAWLAKCYVELDWLYDAEDVITKMRRDSMHYKAVNEWDYTYADYYVHSKQYEQAIGYLSKVIKHEKSRKQRARQWFLMGQLQSALGNRQAAYKAYGKVLRQNPPYEVAFNARIAQTEVMAAGRSKQMIRKLRRMARSDNNKEYLDQVYYAIGNIYMAERDTSNAISAYERGNTSSTRGGIEKGVLLLRLGNIYWDMERYNDAQRCYGEAIGLLDTDRKGYDTLSQRSEVLDELVPYTDAVHLQDSLQWLASLPEAERNAAIDRVIEELKKKEEEERKAQQEAEAEAVLQQQGALGNQNQQKSAATDQTSESGTWYFYNQQAVNQGKTAFQRQWGKRQNVDNWQRVNQTVVNLTANNEQEEEPADTTDVAEQPDDDSGNESGEEGSDGDNKGGKDKKKDGKDGEPADSAGPDPHTREYYLAQIPFTEEQKKQSNEIIMDGLFNSGVIFKDKLDNLPLSLKQLTRLTTQYTDYERGDEAWYHLFLLYSRMGDHAMAQACIERLKASWPESKWTVLLSDPYFEENAKFGEHIEDSIYGATYDAFKAERYGEVKANARISAERFPLGANRAKFIFIEGLGKLNEGDPTGCVESMTRVVEDYPQSEVSEMAGMIIKGVQAGRGLRGGRFDIGDIWARRGADLTAQDSTVADTLSTERFTGYVFLLAYEPDSVDANQLLYDMAKYNFTNFLVRNFDIAVDQQGGICRMTVSGFLNYDEALQYARHLYADEKMAERLKGCRRIIISQENLPLLGTKFSYVEYEQFFDDALAPLTISDEELLNVPESVEQEQEPDDAPKGEDNGWEEEDTMFNQEEPEIRNFDFDDDFYQ